MKSDRAMYRPEPEYEPVSMARRLDLLLISALCWAAVAIATIVGR